MEQKKILLVAISVGIFLVIVIGAAILVFGSNNPSPAMASVRTIQPGTSGTFIVPQPSYSGQPALPDPRADDNQTQGAVISPPVPETSVQAPAVTDAQPIPEAIKTTDSPTVISVSRPTTAAVPDTPPITRSTTSAAQAAAKPATVASAPVQAAPAPQPIPAPQSSPTQISHTVKPAAPKINNDYWVQTGSFTAMSRAQGAKETLAAKGITSIIENRDVNGTTYFRVRVGPYTSQNEADYWLTLIKSINGFENSQIWQSQSIN
jgi:DedD protein